MPLRTARAGRRPIALAVCLACLELAGCAAPAPPLPPADLTDGPKTETIFLVERGWHTDIGLRTTQLGDTLGQFHASFPGVHTLVIGFGERAYMLHPQHDLGDMLAALAPGPGAMLVTALRDAPDAAFPASDVVVLHVSPGGLVRLTDFIAGSFDRASDGTLRPITNESSSDNVLYASTRTYSAGYTCNTWTAEALQIAGLPVHVAGVVFADDVADQARRIASVSH
jgi:uncharacterized protein (TIGR02117 family)